MHLSPKTRSFFPLPSLGFLHTNRLAEMLQVPRKTFRRLQECCKCPEKLFGVCNNVASISRDVLAHCESSVEPLCWLYAYLELTL